MYTKILSILSKYGVNHKELNHASVYTSEDVLEKLGTDVNDESKSMALDLGNQIWIITIPILERLDINKIKRISGIKKISFLKAEKIDLILHVPLGAIAPFGYDEKITCYVSSAFIKRRFFNFNPGLNEITFQIDANDLNKLATAGVIKFIDL